MRRRNKADLPPSEAAIADKRAATSSEIRSEISAIRSNPNRDVIHRWREAYPALENAALENAETTPSVLV
jgi:hypothetical protein